MNIIIKTAQIISLLFLLMVLAAVLSPLFTPMLTTNSNSVEHAALAKTTATPAQKIQRPEYIKPNNAPNGQPWPNSANYVKGYKRLHAKGLSTVTVDNGQNDSDVFVKLTSLDSKQAYPVRQFYIPAFSRFTVNKVTNGSYDIRYRDLNNGRLSRSEAFDLEETTTYDGTQFSNITMTLYKVQNGNMQTYDLSEAEF